MPGIEPESFCIHRATEQGTLHNHDFKGLPDKGCIRKCIYLILIQQGDLYIASATVLVSASTSGL